MFLPGVHVFHSFHSGSTLATSCAINLCGEFTPSIYAEVLTVNSRSPNSVLCKVTVVILGFRLHTLFASVVMEAFHIRCVSRI